MEWIMIIISWLLKLPINMMNKELKKYIFVHIVVNKAIRNKLCYFRNDICPHIPLKNRAKPNSSRSSSSKSESYSFEISVNPRRRRNRNKKIHKNRK